MNNLEINFNNKIVLITGASRGIGKNISDNFKKYGATVIEFDSKKYNFKNEREILKCSQEISNYNQIDILINNAGINYSEYNINLDLEKFNNLMNVNLKAPFVISSQVSKIMKEQKYGRIVNISSIASHRVRDGRSAYSASKFAIEGFTKTLSIELAKYNILVNSVAPGFINTDMTRSMLSNDEINKLSNQVPLKKLGSVNDISNAVLFLSSDLNQFISGHTLVVDGGFLSAVNV